MRARKIYETLEFKQGGDPYKTMRIGKYKDLEEDFTVHGYPVNSGTNPNEIGATLNSIGELVKGQEYVIVEGGTNEWIGDLIYKGFSRNGEHIFRSSLQFEDFTMAFEDTDMEHLITHQEIAHMK